MDYYIEVISNNYKEKTISEFYEILQWFMRLIDYLSQSKRKFLHFKFYLEDENNKFKSISLDNGDHDYRHPIYYGQYIFPQLDGQVREPKFHSLRLSDIKEDLEVIIYSWFKYKDNLKPVIDLYIQNNIPSLDIESILVNQTRMMEIFYNKFFNGSREIKNCYTSNLDNTILEYIIYYHVVSQLGITDDKLLNYPFIKNKIYL